MWVGGVQEDPDNEDSQFIWDQSRTPILSSLWGPDEPNDWNGNEDHVEIWMHSGGQPGLNDYTGSRAKTYLCEAEKAQG